MIIDIGTYRIQPHGGGLCWELYEFQPAHVGERGRGSGKDIPDRYVPLGRYPSNLEHAISMVAEMLAKDDPAQGDAATIKTAFAKMCATLEVAVREGSPDEA